VDLRSAILENDVTQPGGKLVRRFESGIGRHDTKRRDLLLRALSLATETKKTYHQ
jgi:hypothetical protein